MVKELIFLYSVQVGNETVLLLVLPLLYKLSSLDIVIQTDLSEADSLELDYQLPCCKTSANLGTMFFSSVISQSFLF